MENKHFFFTVIHYALTFQNETSFRVLFWAGNGKEKQDSLAEKLFVHIIKNLQITIHNIHFRYEDAYTNPKHPFSVGVSLAELVFQVYIFSNIIAQFLLCKARIYF